MRIEWSNVTWVYMSGQGVRDLRMSPRGRAMVYGLLPPHSLKSCLMRRSEVPVANLIDAEFSMGGACRPFQTGAYGEVPLAPDRRDRVSLRQSALRLHVKFARLNPLPAPPMHSLAGSN